MNGTFNDVKFLVDVEFVMSIVKQPFEIKLDSRTNPENFICYLKIKLIKILTN